MKNSTIEFAVNGNTESIRLTEKGCEYEAFAVKGVRWFQKSYGNTYHKAYLSGLKNGVWQPICHSDNMQYGYGEQYLCTATQLMVEAGLIECSNEYALNQMNVRQALNLEHYAEDVQRKKDM